MNVIKSNIELGELLSVQDLVSTNSSRYIFDYLPIEDSDLAKISSRLKIYMRTC